jgi:hypothetical protein
MADPEKPPRKPPRRRPRKRDGDGEREPYKEEPDAVRIHEAYLEHRRAGGAEPDPDAYLRAIEEFDRLPGTRPPPTSAESSETDDEADDQPAKEGPAQ